MVDFNYFDVVITAIILILGIKGFVHGFAKELFGLIGLVGGVYFATRLAETAAIFIDANFLHLENRDLLKLLGFLAILVTVWFTMTILGAIFSSFSNNNPSIISRFLGFLCGATKYFIVFALIVSALSHAQLAKDKLQKYVQHSQLYPYLVQAGSMIIYTQEPQTQTVSSKNNTNNTSADEGL